MDHESYLEEWEKRNKEHKDKQKQKEYSMLNGILFLSFIVPAAFALMVGLPMNFFYTNMIIVWVHEAGHGFWCLMGSRFLCAFGGFLNEMLFTLIPALICFKERGIYLAGCIFIMCVGMSIQFNGWYMQSAEHPHGTSFAGALTGQYNDVTPESHDWSVIFREIGLIKHSYKIGKFTEEFGRGIAIIFFITSILAALPVSYGWRPEKLTTFVGYGAIVSAVYFILSGADKTAIILALILSIPLLWALINRKKPKPKTIEQDLDKKDKPEEAAKKDKEEKEEKPKEVAKKEKKETRKSSEKPGIITSKKIIK